MRLRKGLRVCLFCLAAVTVLIMAVACSPSSEGDTTTAAPPTVKQPILEQDPPSGETGELETESGTESGNTEEETANGNDELETPAGNRNGSAGQLYALTFEDMMKMDEALNHEMNYIAVDLSEMTQLTEDDKTYIIEYLQGFGAEIRDRTLDQLVEEENPDQSSPSLKGVLLRVDKVEINEDSAQIEGSKYRSGTGAIGVKITLKLQKGAWKLSDSEMTWIS
ncbi:hypothetical protein M0651_09365 [Paenibacillus sp. MBLB2552]|uniref:Lipoprotein n=1 Tax=Paenibacillus mellifer TaxID=2937794 RepID=A0A9X1XXG7_9BACL|nr:hypothetical protein [Paenibacillus mellifer]MCK8487380.1 hypothetical protein [Paenibacillus mellifer]